MTKDKRIGSNTAPMSRRGSTPAARLNALSVLFVTRKWPPAVGGMETYSKHLTDALKDRCNLSILALPGLADGSAPGVARLLWFGLRAFVAILFSRRAPDVVHVADMASWPLALAGKMRAPRAQVVISAHGTDVSFGARPGAKGGLYRAYLVTGRRVLRDIRVISNSRATAEAVQHYGFWNARIIPLAAELSETNSNATRGNHLLFAGRLVERKGLSWFVANVLPILPDEIRLEVAGTVWENAEADSLSDPRVDYLGALRPDKLARAYARALCVVVPNIELRNGEFEGFGLVATEAAAAGGVVLAAGTQGLRHAISDGETGFHLPPGDAQAWANKIVEIQNWDANERSQFLARAKQVSKVHFSWDRVADETSRVYLGQPGQARSGGV